MKTTTLLFLSLTSLAGVAGCGSDASDASTESETGTVELSLSSVPSDTGCLKVVVAGTRTVTRLFDLTPGTSPTFTLDRLPIGIVKIDGQGFSGACSSVGPTSVPAFVAEAPITVRIDTSKVVTVLLKLIRNGRITVGVDFEAPPWISTFKAPVDVAIIGDTPYGAAQIADFPKLISDMSLAMPQVAEIVHLGDIKNGSTRCDTSHFQFVLDNFNLSTRPIVYTPGDNEWTDCHRPNNGGFNPLERLATIRTMFFPVSGLSLGATPKQVLSQAFFPGFETYAENQMWVEAGTVFTLVHVVGSNNSLLPWTVDDPTRRTAEEAARNAANLDWLDRSFATAKSEGVADVVVIMQADMWDGTPLDGFNATVQKIATLSVEFAKPVLLVEGDSHVFKTDNPLAAGSPVHGVTTPVPNLTRIVVQGSTTAPLTEWLRLHVDPAASPPFSWTRNPR